MLSGCSVYRATSPKDSMVTSEECKYRKHFCSISVNYTHLRFTVVRTELYESPLTQCTLATDVVELPRQIDNMSNAHNVNNAIKCRHACEGCPTASKSAHRRSNGTAENETVEKSVAIFYPSRFRKQITSVIFLVDPSKK